jgi:hypothetical protein
MVELVLFAAVDSHRIDNANEVRVLLLMLVQNACFHFNLKITLNIFQIGIPFKTQCQYTLHPP